MNYENMDTSKPIVSVIIPIHNRFLFADQTIVSVIFQTYRPIELIIVDDCSDELYKPKINSNKEIRITVFRHNENKGPGASRETGRQASIGKYIAYLDSDDLWHPEKLQKQVAMLEAHPDAGMCYCQSVEFTQWPLTGRESYRSRSDRRYSEFLPVILDQRPWGTGACLWTKDATDLIGPWSDSWHFEDVEYESRAGCKDIKISYVPEVLCYYRLNGDSGSLSNSLSKFSINQLSKSVLKISKNIQKCGKPDNDEIRASLIRRVFKTGFLALKYHDRISAFKLFLKISTISKDILIKLIFFQITFFSLIFPVSIMDRIKYLLKSVIFSQSSTMINFKNENSGN